MNWKAYEEVHFSANNIQRWVREGDEYVNRMTLEQMGEFETKVRQQADRIAELEKENSNLKYEISSGAWQPKEATDQELFNIYAHLQDTYKGNNFPVALGRKILKLYATPQTKPLSDEEIKEIADNVCYLIDKDKKGRTKGAMYIEDFARAIEERHGIK